MDLEREYEQIARNAGYGSPETIAGRAVGQGLAFLGLAIVKSAGILADAIENRSYKMNQPMRPPVPDDKRL